MATYTALDPRVYIRNQIGYSKYLNEMDCSTISVTDNWDDTVYIPLYLPGEVRTGDLPPMPFIEMTLRTSPAHAMSIGGGVRNQECYMDFNIYYTHTEQVTPTEFGKTVADEIIDKITIDRSSVASTYFVEIVNDGREIIEQTEGKQTIFHRVLETHVKNFT